MNFEEWWDSQVRDGNQPDDHVTPFDQFLYGNRPCMEAQPPAQSKYAPPYPDQAQDPFWKVPGMVDTRPKAQPPAARVTDAIARRMVAEYDAVLCGDPTATRTDGMRAALEAALAAQENPNG